MGTRAVTKGMMSALALRKRYNAMKVLGSYSTGIDADIMPMVVEFEVTNRCQLKCVFCPRDEHHRKQGKMDPALVRRIIDETHHTALEADGQTYALVQFHMHSPSEHRIEGKAFPLEVYFVHENERGELAVVAVLFREGPHHRGLATIEARASLQAGKRHPIDTPIADLDIVPEGRAHYRYSGSLTTPPCTEGVMWLILKETGSVSKEQVATFVKMIGEDGRGPQPLNGRLVVH